MRIESPAAWFCTLGEPLGQAEAAEIAAYLAALGLAPKLPTLVVASWRQAAEIARTPAEHWWDAEEAERARLERVSRLDPADREWLALTDALHGAAGAGDEHPFVRKYALFSGGRWPLGVYGDRFAIF